MAAPIGNIPRGFLSLLALKQTGVNPPALLDNVQPSMDMRTFYDQGLIVGEQQLFPGIANLNLVTGNIGLQNVPSAVCPQNNMYFIYQAFAVAAGNLAADTISMQLVKRFPSGSPVSYVSVGPISQDVITGRIRIFSCRADQPFYLLPGEQMCVEVIDVLIGTNINVALYVRGVQMLI